MTRIRTALLTALLVACGVQDAEQPLPDGGGGHDGHDARMEATHASDTIIDATSNEIWTYWSLTSGDVTDSAWDLGFRRTQLATNSGTSGSGTAGAVSTSVTDWAAVTECPADGYQADTMLPIPGPPGSGEYSGNPALADWFDYDPATHAVSSKGFVYCIRAADGTYAKLTIVNYAGGQMTIRWSHQPDGTRALR